MILKSYEIKKIQQSILEKKIFLFYGENYGLKKEIGEIVKSIICGDNEVEQISLFEEDVLKNEENFYNFIFGGSLFNNKKIIYVHNVTDKMLKNINNIVIKFPEDLLLFLFSEILEKKSKLRNFFEKENNIACVPCYLDNEKTLAIITQKELIKNKIILSRESIGLLIRKANGDRGNLLNEIEKIKSFSKNNKKIEHEQIKHLINSNTEIKHENLINICRSGDISELKRIVTELSIEKLNQILLLKILSNKIRRLLNIKNQNEEIKNIDSTINNQKPPIFWKEKPLIKKQLTIWKTDELEKTIFQINDIEISCKSNPQVSSFIFSNFLTGICKKANYYL